MSLFTHPLCPSAGRPTLGGDFSAVAWLSASFRASGALARLGGSCWAPCTLDPPRDCRGPAERSPFHLAPAVPPVPGPGRYCRSRWASARSSSHCATLRFTRPCGPRRSTRRKYTRGKEISPIPALPQGNHYLIDLQFDPLPLVHPDASLRL